MFFGEIKHSDIIIVTPLTLIFETLFKDIKPESSSRGWWLHKKIVLETNNLKQTISIMKIQPGNSIIDFIHCLDNPKKIIFIGFAGGIDNSLSIGQVIIPKIALMKNKKVEIKNSIYDKKYSVYAVNTFFEQNKIFINKMVKRKISCLDMETFLLYNEAKKMKINVVSILIISDLVRKLPFYEVKKSDFDFVNMSLTKVEEIIKNEIRNK
jgi:purine-nucleoside phosphorylase